MVKPEMDWAAKVKIPGARSSFHRRFAFKWPLNETFAAPIAQVVVMDGLISDYLKVICLLKKNSKIAAAEFQHPAP
jgi:hypothetical protein